MSFFITATVLNLKRAVMPPMLVFTIILAAALFIGNYVQKELELQVAIGIYFESESEISEEIIRNLESFSNISIKHYNDKSKMQDDISAVEIECGYIFDRDVVKYIESGSINRAAKLYKSNATVGDGFTNELVFAALMKTAAPYISTNYLNGKIDEEYAEILKEAKREISAYYESDIFLDINVKAVGEASRQRADNRITAGIVSSFLFILFFYAAIDGIEEKRSGVYTKLEWRHRVLYLASHAAAYALLSFVASYALFYNYGGAGSFLVLELYIAALAAISLAAIVFIKSAKPLYALSPIICAAVITLGGAFFDISEISPALGKISRFFPTYYFYIYM